MSLFGYPYYLWAAPYVGADITLQGNEFSSKDEEFTPFGDSIWLYVCSDNAGVSYEVDLMPGIWRVGVNARNISGSEYPEIRCTSYPFWEGYEHFDMSTTLSDAIIEIPASETEIQYGFIEVGVASSGPQMVSFTWLNDYYSWRQGRDVNLRVTDDPFFTQDAVSITGKGLLTSSTTSTGLTSTYGYDALGRRTSVTDPRTSTRTTHYNTKDQVEWTEDAAGNRTSYTYDPDTGRRISVTRAAGTSVARTVQYQYDLKGQLEQVSGDTEPVDYSYDDYGRKISMTTYRNDTGDTTTWVYEEATGLLLEKVYADGNKTNLHLYP